MLTVWFGWFTGRKIHATAQAKGSWAPYRKFGQFLANFNKFWQIYSNFHWFLASITNLEPALTYGITFQLLELCNCLRQNNIAFLAIIITRLIIICNEKQRSVSRAVRYRVQQICKYTDGWKVTSTPQKKTGPCWMKNGLKMWLLFIKTLKALFFILSSIDCKKTNLYPMK